MHAQPQGLTSYGLLRPLIRHVFAYPGMFSISNTLGRLIFKGVLHNTAHFRVGAAVIMHACMNPAATPAFVVTKISC